MLKQQAKPAAARAPAAAAAAKQTNARTLADVEAAVLKVWPYNSRVHLHPATKLCNGVCYKPWL